MEYRIDQRGIVRSPDWERWEWLEHGFSTRQTGDFGPFGIVGKAPALFGAPEMETVRLRQVHSDRVVAVVESGGAPPEADALVSDRPGLLLQVRTADCAPLLLVDPIRRAVSAVHAGWRGTVGGIAQHAVERLCGEYGCRVEDLQALVGPCISLERFEVGDEVAGRFSAEVVRRQTQWERPHVDLRAALKSQLVVAGLLPEKILAIELCTHERADLFFSHRRTGEPGRMAAALGIRH